MEPPVTRLYGVNILENKPGTCLVYTNYAFDIAIMQQSTLKKMEVKPLPSFEKSKRMVASRTSTKHTTSTKSLRTTTPRPRTITPIKKPITRPPAPPAPLAQRVTSSTPKITTIYLTSTEKIVTSTEFRPNIEEDEYEEDDEDILSSTTTSRSVEMTTTLERELNRIESPEKSKILERDHDRVGLMTTLHAKQDPEQNWPNASATSDLLNKDPLSKAACKLYAFCILYCLFFFVLE
ncbi:hypothetical protein OESDEN_18649 [Oesophagostomum dentatum]|uniref:Uncharacterized protein n=1 Tax=Oesophagostomum dentatum TaxID=61180 RepID=A0A0B1S8S5_OESDE|nr:hypothetical protein OESDEN_18649 [Oesophagostomum dentatum]